MDSYSANDYGLYNMSGNVAEWTSTAFDESVYDFDHDMNPNIRMMLWLTTPFDEAEGGPRWLVQGRRSLYPDRHTGLSNTKTRPSAISVSAVP